MKILWEWRRRQVGIFQTGNFLGEPLLTSDKMFTEIVAERIFRLDSTTTIDDMIYMIRKNDTGAEFHP